MKNRLSHTAASTFRECPYKYNLRYNHKLRPTTVRSALFFGSALDKAVEEVSLGKGDGVETFIKTLTEYDLNGSKETIPGNPLFIFSQTDFDSEILTPEDCEELLVTNQDAAENDYQLHLGWKKDKVISDGQLRDLNMMYWVSMKRKGLLMLQAYKDQIIPKIKKVIDVQRQITVTNDDGDSITGFVDLICEWEDGRRIIFDLKTSSSPYKDDSVRISDQLGLYCFALENHFKTRHCGYIVIPKRIKKKRKNKVVTPYVEIQVLIEEMPTERDEAVINDFDHVNNEIKQSSFDKNLTSCYNYGGCDYFNFCHKNDSSGLIKIEYVDEITTLDKEN